MLTGRAIGAVVDHVAQHLGGRNEQRILLCAPQGYRIERVTRQFVEKRVRALGKPPGLFYNALRAWRISLEVARPPWDWLILAKRILPLLSSTKVDG